MVFSSISINSLTIAEYEKVYSVMSCERKAKVDRLRLVNDKKRTLAGEWLIRKMLYENFAVPFEESIIRIGEKGKPYVETAPYHISISHSGDLVTGAVSSAPIGVDVEEIRQVSLHLAKKVCIEEELLYVFSHVPSDEDFKKEHPMNVCERFLEIWTIKEAYFKMLGTGITDFKKVNALSPEIKKERIYMDGYIVYTVKG